MNEKTVALVTGAAGALGRVIVERLAADGACVAALDLAVPRDEVQRDTGAAGWWSCDVTDAESVDAAVASIAERFGRIDWCIANAGVVRRAPVLEITPGDWQAVLDVNLTGAFYTAQSCARRMRERGGGRIVMTSSWVQEVPAYGILSYCVSKAGLRMLVKGMALELGEYGIRVNAVAPGYVEAGISGEAIKRDPSRRARVLRDIPLGELQSAESVADAVTFLCSPGSSYMTGSVLLVDGGNSLYYRRRLEMGGA